MISPFCSSTSAYLLTPSISLRVRAAADKLLSLVLDLDTDLLAATPNEAKDRAVLNLGGTTRRGFRPR